MVSKINNITRIPDISGVKSSKNYTIKTEDEINNSIEQYLRQISNSGTNPPPAAELPKFLELVQNAIWSRQTTESIPEDKRLLVLGEDPPKIKALDSEAITFHLETRGPGQYSQGPAGSPGIKEVVSHLRSVQQHPEHIGEKLITMGRKFDNIVAFNVYAGTDIRALKRVLWFENVMAGFRWYFRLHRVKPIQQDVRRVGKVVIGELSLVKYKVSFFVGTEDTYQIGQQELKRVAMNVDMTTN